MDRRLIDSSTAAYKSSPSIDDKLPCRCLMLVSIIVFCAQNNGLYACVRFATGAARRSVTGFLSKPRIGYVRWSDSTLAYQPSVEVGAGNNEKSILLRRIFD